MKRIILTLSAFLLISTQAFAGAILSGVMNVASGGGGGGGNISYIGNTYDYAYQANATFAASSTGKTFSVGDLVIHCISNDNSYTVSTMTDSASTPNTYTVITTASDSIGENIACWKSKITTAVTNATITTTLSGASAAHIAAQTYVLRGGTGAIDASQGSTATGVTDLTGSTGITTTNANDVIIAAWVSRNGRTPTIGAPWTAGANSYSYQSSEYQTVASTSTYKATATWTGADTYAVIIIGAK